MSLKGKKAKNQANSGEPSKLRLMSQTRNLWNPRPRLNKIAQFPMVFILMDWIEKNIYINLEN